MKVCKVHIDEKKQELAVLYSQWEKQAQPYVEAAVCRAGCSDCCTNVGMVDATTLEAYNILLHIQNLPRKIQESLSEKVKRNRKEKSRSKYARCAFLLDDNTCTIYSVRPFSCRRIYSVKKCGETGPTVQRKLWALSEHTLATIQQLDDNGYSGHITHMLVLLKDARFRKTYVSGGFSPEEVRDFAQLHGISINRFASTPFGDFTASPVR